MRPQLVKVVVKVAASFAALLWSLSGCAPAGSPSTPADVGPADPTVEYVARQQILTALPMRVRLPARYGAARVYAFVHLWGTPAWRTIELQRDGQAWDGEVSCRAVSTVTGDTRYFFLAVNADGEEVVSSGSPEWPHVATIVRELPDGPQSLPHHEAPAICHDPADCPSDFAGCPAYTAVRATCSSDDDCDGVAGHAGRCAWDGYCEGPGDPTPSSLSSEEALAVAVRKVLKRPQTARARARAGVAKVE